MIPFTDATAVRLPEREYFDFMLASLEAARRRIWVSLFICDIRPHRDPEGLVLELVTTLVERRAVGVDVRVLLPGAVGTPDIDVANLATGVFSLRNGVAHRRVLADGEQVGSHAKFVVCDDIAVVGSQNWTDDSLRSNIDDAVILEGPPVELLAAELLRLWAKARGLPRP